MKLFLMTCLGVLVNCRGLQTHVFQLKVPVDHLRYSMRHYTNYWPDRYFHFDRGHQRRLRQFGRLTIQAASQRLRQILHHFRHRLFPRHFFLMVTFKNFVVFNYLKYIFSIFYLEFKNILFNKFDEENNLFFLLF